MNATCASLCTSASSASEAAGADEPLKAAELGVGEGGLDRRQALGVVGMIG